jgi:hypothetical protein
VSGLDSQLLAVFELARDLVHPLTRHRVDIRRRTEHHREDVVAGRRFGQVNVGFQTDAFEIADLLGRHDVVEVLGHGVRIEAHAGADDLRSAEAQAANRIARAVDQIFRKFAGSDFLREFLLVGRVEDVIQVRKQRAESETHRIFRFEVFRN